LLLSRRGKTVITRSLIFSRAAEEKDAESLLVIKDKALAEKYIKNWQDHARHSEIYQGRGRYIDRPRGEDPFFLTKGGFLEIKDL
jgi:phosphatidylserine/phosphatidylglycerophosphate/cardiolipin synthase-like enzyme